MFIIFFFFNDTATTEIYTLSLHDALPILEILEGVEERELANGATLHWGRVRTTDSVTFYKKVRVADDREVGVYPLNLPDVILDWKSTRLNSSHANISYAVFCLKKKNNYKK